VVNGGGL